MAHMARDGSTTGPSDSWERPGAAGAEPCGDHRGGDIHGISWNREMMGISWGNHGGISRGIWRKNEDFLRINGCFETLSLEGELRFGKFEHFFWGSGRGDS